jgi:hypothetical protein
MTATTCPNCRTTYNGDACPICAPLERIRAKARERRRTCTKRTRTEPAQAEPRLPYKD